MDIQKEIKERDERLDSLSLERECKKIERALRANLQHTFTDIENGMKYGVNPKPFAVSKQTEYDRVSIYERALSNPALAKALRSGIHIVPVCDMSQERKARKRVRK